MNDNLDTQSKETQLQLVGDTDIVITHSFAAPAEVVFEAITDPEHVKRWWAPKSRGEMLICEMDVRVGGKWRHVMRTNSGFEAGFSGEYREIAAPHRIVCTEVFDPFPQVVSLVTVTLEERAGVTTLTNHVSYPSREVRDQVLATGMEHGMRESYRQLHELIRRLAASKRR
ncbi:MAG TPA: SRPBCC family protein [Polyangiaceae bacterium]|nr:SRPBCC family protein [Polyangiaceae bacterium]